MNKDLRILITGGAGYIGSHVVKALLEAHFSHLIVLDNLSSGFANSVENVKFIHGDVRDFSLLSHVLATEKIEAVMHFAALTHIPQSIQQPLLYYQNNAVGCAHLLQACLDHHVKYFIFSSTAAVYGQTTENISENNPLLPTNPYGRAKLMAEQMIKDSGLNYVILRYFNVAGADVAGKIGQRTPQATHLIKVAVQTACGLHPAVPIYGLDYPTFDGSCIRDFIHVTDLAHAHLQALDYLQQKGKSVILNCGYGTGYSVKQVIEAVEKMSQRPLPTVICARRSGDLARVVADNHYIQKVLGWRPSFASLPFIVKTAYEWEKKLLQHL